MSTSEDNNIALHLQKMQLNTEKKILNKKNPTKQKLV